MRLLTKVGLLAGALLACSPASTPLSQPAGGGGGPGPPPGGTVDAPSMSAALDAVCGSPVGRIWVRWTSAWGCNSALGFFDPIWWGADPTGVSDSGAACTAAFAALPATGGTIRFTPGTYNFTTNCTIPSTMSEGTAVNVRMEGAQLSTVTPNVHIFDRSFTTQASANSVVGFIIRFYGGVLKGNSTPAAPNGQIGINLGATYNASTNGVYYQQFDMGLYCQFCLNFRSVHDRSFANSLYGIKLDQGQWSGGAGSSSSTAATIEGFRDYGATPTGTWAANALTAMTWATGGVVTATTTNPHGVQVGDTFKISSAVPVAYDGNFVAQTGTTGNTLVFTMQATTNPGAVTTLGTLAAGAHFYQLAYIAAYASDGITVRDFIGEGGNTLNGIEFDTKGNTIVKSFTVSNYHGESTPANSFIKLNGSFGGIARFENIIVQSQSYLIDSVGLGNAGGQIEVFDTPYVAAFVSPIFNVTVAQAQSTLQWVFRNFGLGATQTDLTNPQQWSAVPAYVQNLWNSSRTQAGNGIQAYCQFCYMGSQYNPAGGAFGIFFMGNSLFQTDDKWYIGASASASRPHSIFMGTGAFNSAGALVSSGTRPTATGGGGTCAGASSAGGALAGTVTLTGACAAGNTLALTGMPVAPAGYSCEARDRTTPAALLQQTSSTTTSATFTFAGTTSGATDVIQYGPCTGF